MYTLCLSLLFTVCLSPLHIFFLYPCIQSVCPPCTQYVCPTSMESKSLGGFWHGGCPKDTSRKLHINFQISTCLGSASSPMCLQSGNMESKRTLEVPERSLGGFWDAVCPKDTSRKLHINFHIYTILERTPSLMCLQSIIMETRKLHIDFQVSTLLESASSPGFSRASSKCHPWSQRGCWRFLRGVLVVFDTVVVPYIHLGSYVSIFSSLPPWEVFYLLGSPENHHGVLEDVPDSCDFG